MDRTLYLTEKKGTDIRRDGPSVWIKEAGKAGRRVPARLISRVVVIGPVRLDAAIVLLFAEHNVPVAFMDERGEHLAVALPYNNSAVNHREDQKALLESEETVQMYVSWATAERRRFQIQTMENLAGRAGAVFAQRGFRERDYQDFIRRQYTGGEERWSLANRVITDLFRETITSRLVAAALDPHVGILHRRQNFGLVLDMAHVLGPEIDLQTVRFMRRDMEKGHLQKIGDGLKISKDGVKDIVYCFENRKKLVHDMIESVIDGLFQVMREVRCLT